MSLQNFFNKEQAPASNTAGIQVDLSTQIAAEGAVAMANTQVEQLFTMGEALDNIAEGIQASVEDGGLSRESAAFVNIAAQNALAGTGVAVRMPNMQSFSGGQSDRQQATSICMQSVKAKLKSVYQAIVKAIRNAIAKIREWFRSFMNNVPKLISALKALQEKADGVTGSIEEKDFEVSSGVANQLRLENKVDTAKFNDGIGVLTEVAKAFYTDADNLKKISDAGTEALDLIAEQEDMTSLVNKSAQVLKKIDDASDVSVKNDAAMAKAVVDQDLVAKADADKVGVVATPRLFGDQVIWMAIPKPMGQVTIENQLTHYRLLGKVAFRKSDASKNQKKIESAQKVKTMSSSEVSDTCDKLIALLEIFEKNDKDFTAAEKAKSSILESADKAIDAVESYKAEDGEDKDGVKNGRKLAKGMLDGIVKLTGGLDSGMRLCMSESVVATKAIMGVMEASLKNHK